jgi:hypothetical protein
MIPYDVDPSLHTAEPEPPQLDDGFSPPAQEPGVPESKPAQPAASAGVLGDKSAF